MSNLRYWIWLVSRKGEAARLKLLKALGSPEAVYFAGEDAYRQVPDMPQEVLASYLDKSLQRADEILGACDRLGLRILTIQDALYPDRLRSIYRPPLLLYTQGMVPRFDDLLAVAVVGTRDCTPYGRSAAEKIAFELAGSGAAVLSGLAAGIDACAHTGALRAGGLTAAVIGGGHDKIYPKENADLYRDIAASGVILSEYPPGTAPMAGHFPLRNRIISGLCSAVLVVEAPMKSGALITARLALEQGREAYAVPGPIDAPNSQGCHQLLLNGAGLVTAGEDLLRFYRDRFALRDAPPPLPPDLIMNGPSTWKTSPAPQRPAKDGTDAADGTAPPLKEAGAVKAPRSGRRDAKAAAGPARPARSSRDPKAGQPVIDPMSTELPPELLDTIAKAAQTPPPPREAKHPEKGYRDPSLGLTDDQILVMELLAGRSLSADEIIEGAQIPARRASSALTVLQVDSFITKEGMYYRAIR